MIAPTEELSYLAVRPLGVPEVLHHNLASLYDVAVAVFAYDLAPLVAPPLCCPVALPDGCLPSEGAGSVDSPYHEPEVISYSFSFHCLAHTATLCLSLGYSWVMVSSAMQRDRKPAMFSSGLGLGIGTVYDFLELLEEVAVAWSAPARLLRGAQVFLCEEGKL